jgi:peptidoglycan hydrolase-like protein with peptidoglycan-binding domain
MPLKSDIFAGDPRLEDCLVNDAAHLSPGAKGDHVARVQAALIFLDGLTIADGELGAMTYGPSTAAAVLAFKKKRKIINRAYQNQEDDIVGKMTIKALDDEMAAAGYAENLVDAQVCPGKL